MYIHMHMITNLQALHTWARLEIFDCMVWTISRRGAISTFPSPHFFAVPSSFPVLHLSTRASSRIFRSAIRWALERRAWFWTATYGGETWLHRLQVHTHVTNFRDVCTLRDHTHTLTHTHTHSHTHRGCTCLSRCRTCDLSKWTLLSPNCSLGASKTSWS